MPLVLKACHGPWNQPYRPRLVPKIGSTNSSSPSYKHNITSWVRAKTSHDVVNNISPNSHSSLLLPHISHPIKMRYEDWDVLLFEEGSSIPSREFKVTCHVVQHAGKSTFGVPNAKANHRRVHGLCSSHPYVLCSWPQRWSSLSSVYPFLESIKGFKW